MYARGIEGRVYDFGVSGKLIMNVLVMYDRQTDSLWSQLLGEAIEGPMAGTKLEFLPAELTTWQDWRDRHPDTLALVKGYRGAVDSYTGYSASSQAGVLGETRRDERLYVKEFIVGVEHQGLAVAYPYSRLNQEPVVNDRIGDLPVLVLFDPQTGGGLVFDRRAEGQTLTFRAVDGDRVGDRETGSVWEWHTGRAVEGPLVGHSLRRVKSTSSFWFGWKDWYPETRVYGQAQAPPG